MNDRSDNLSSRPSRRRSPLTRLLDAIGSVWFGVSMMVAILIYAWVGSGGVPVLTRVFPPGFTFWFVRQEFEKTEMEWFAWWPFNLLLALLAVSLVLVTLRRIKLNRPNLGVWTVHVGILVLMVGCAIYFGRKIEGDMAVYRRQAVMSVPGGEAALILRPGERTILRGDDSAYQVQVDDLNPEYELLTGDDKGKTTYAAQLRFTPLGRSRDSQPFIRQLLVGYPEYTEDVVPGAGRAIKVLGRPLVDERVEARLEYVPTSTVHLHNRMSLYARVEGRSEWAEMPLDGLPKYREHALPSSDVLTAAGTQALPMPALSLEGDWSKGAENVPEELQLRVTGYLPFARLIDRWVPGGDRFSPYVRLSARFQSGGRNVAVSQELLAAVPGRARATLGDERLPVSFKWVETEQELERLIDQPAPMLTVRIPERGIERRIPLSDVLDEDLVLGGYTLRLLEMFPSWTLASTGELASMAIVRIEGPRGSFRRAVVSPRAELSQDIDDSGARHQGLIDDQIRVELDGIPESGLVVVGGPVGLHLLLVNQGGGVMHEPADQGSTVSFLDGALSVTIDEISRTSRFARQPLLISERERDVKAGSFYSLIRVEMTDGQWGDSAWIEYSHYSHPSVLGFNPVTIALPDGRRVELLYSRERYELEHPVVLEDFQLETYPGRQRERDYISLVRFFEAGQPSELQEVRSNQPSEHDGWWFFQSTWDPPRPQVGHAGMNYTGLGVGNRHGVFVMLLGSAMTVLGTLYAFYYKPVLLRRIRDRARERAATASAAREQPPRVGREAVARVGEST